MIEDLFKIVQGYSQEMIDQNSAVSTEKKDGLAQHLTGSLIDGLKDQISQGNITQLLDVFSQKSTTVGQPAMDNMQGQVINSLSQKMGLNPSVAGSIVSAVLPSVLAALSKKASDPNDSSLDFNGIFSALGGKGGLDLNSMMNRLDDDNDGFGLDDITKLVSENKGGIMGMLGGLFSK